MERLSGLDATFLYLETPTHHMHVAATMVIDPSTMPGGYSFEKIKDFIGAASTSCRRSAAGSWRCRSASTTRSGSRTRTSTSTTTSAASAAPSPGGRRELGEVAGQMASTQLDRSRPAVGALGRRGAQARPGRHRHEGPPLRHRRRLRRGADGAPLRPRAGGGRSAAARLASPSASRPSIELLGYAAVSRARRNLGFLPLSAPRSQSVSRVAQGRRAPEHQVGAEAALRAPRTPWNAALGRAPAGRARRACPSPT